MRDLPRGTVTLLFTDIEGSTRLLHELGDEYADVLAEHRRLLREAFGRHGGVEVDTQGDAFFYAFERAADAVAAAADAQADLRDGPVRVRIGVHTGEPLVTDEGYVGMDVHRAARIMSAGHGGQVVVSEYTRAQLDGDAILTDLGLHRLKDLGQPEKLFQLGDDQFPPLKTLDATNLPIAASPLLGRERELAELVPLLQDGTRLLTITGPGGTGKTRLALQVAAELVGSLADGVFWVPLAGVDDPELVLPTIGQTIGTAGDLAEHLRGRQLLLLLDNAEHLLAAAPGLAELLTVSPQLRLLVTSRAPLHVAAEREYPLDPLSTNDAVTLFVERARGVGRDLDADATIEAICDRLDGLPLAVELAAARVKYLDPGTLLVRLERALPLLTGGARDAPERQRTLRATIEWSYDLLSDSAKDLFTRVSVFAGSFSVVAAEEVADADLDGLALLVGFSLLKPIGDDRFLMLETMREYATERLEGLVDGEQTRRRHAEWVARVAAEAEPELRRENAAVWLDLLTMELDNVRAALTWASENDPVLALRIAAALWAFWVDGGHTREGMRWLEVASDEGVSVDVRRSTLRAKGAIAMSMYDVPRLAAVSEERLELALATNDDAEAGSALNGLAVAARYDGDYARARRLFEAALSYARRTDDVLRISGIVANLGQVAEETGDFAEARRLFEEDLKISREHGSALDVVWALANVANAAIGEGEHDEAARRLREAAELADSVGDVGHLPMLLTTTAILTLARSDMPRTAQLIGAVAQLCEDQGMTILPTAGREWHRARDLACAALGDAEFDRLAAEGRALVPERAVELMQASVD
jgi:predicted ATPase/class 3 adenylate cyclase